MTLAASVLSFCFVFFFILSMVNAAGSHHQKQNAEIEGRLKTAGPTASSIGLEKEDYFSRLPFLDRFLRKTAYTKKFQNFLSQSGLSLTVGGFFLMSVLSGLTCFLFSINIQ